MKSFQEMCFHSFKPMVTFIHLYIYTFIHLYIYTLYIYVFTESIWVPQIIRLGQAIVTSSWIKDMGKSLIFHSTPFRAQPSHLNTPKFYFWCIYKHSNLCYVHNYFWTPQCIKSILFFKIHKMSLNSLYALYSKDM